MQRSSDAASRAAPAVAPTLGTSPAVAFSSAAGPPAPAASRGASMVAASTAKAWSRGARQARRAQGRGAAPHW